MLSLGWQGNNMSWTFFLAFPRTKGELLPLWNTVVPIRNVLLSESSSKMACLLWTNPIKQCRNEKWASWQTSQFCLKRKTIEKLETVSLVVLNSCILYLFELNLEKNQSKSSIIKYYKYSGWPTYLVDLPEETKSNNLLEYTLINDQRMTWGHHIHNITSKSSLKHVSSTKFESAL